MSWTNPRQLMNNERSVVRTDPIDDFKPRGRRFDLVEKATMSMSRHRQIIDTPRRKGARTEHYRVRKSPGVDALRSERRVFNTVHNSTSYVDHRDELVGG
jgi:hypothetical protein